MVVPQSRVAFIETGPEPMFIDRYVREIVYGAIADRFARQLLLLDFVGYYADEGRAHGELLYRSLWSNPLLERLLKYLGKFLALPSVQSIEARAAIRRTAGSAVVDRLGRYHEPSVVPVEPMDLVFHVGYAVQDDSIRLSIDSARESTVDLILDADLCEHLQQLVRWELNRVR